MVKKHKNDTNKTPKIIHLNRLFVSFDDEDVSFDFLDGCTFGL